jgi:hypothetical protein
VILIVLTLVMKVTVNVFRVSTIVREGVVDDGEWRQKVVYQPGLNNSWWVQKKLSGAFGHGLQDQIKDVYKLICEHNLGSVPISVDSEDWSFQRDLLVHRSKIHW